jgi:hypothetical protein
VAINQAYAATEHESISRALTTAAAERIVELEDRYAALQQRYQAVIHERDRLLEQVATVVRQTRHEPALTIWCDTPSCAAMPLTIAVLPPEDAIPGWVRGNGWTVDGDRYACPGCAR